MSTLTYPLRRSRALLAAICVLTASSAFLRAAEAGAAGSPLGLPAARPEAVGFSSERLARVEQYLRGEVGAGRYAGAAWLAARDGKVVTHGALGQRDLGQRLPFTEETPVRIYSMTKVITCVVVLALFEEGRFNLNDPIGKYLPELAKMKVMTGGAAEAPELVAAKRAISIRHLLTHTSGLGYDLLGANKELREIYLRANLWRGPANLQEFAAKVGQLPLHHHPGDSWTYGINMDVLGAFVERITGKSFEDVLRERIFGPLGMTATTFRPSAAQLAALAKVYRRGKTGGLEPEKMFGLDFNETAIPTGGAGLISTLHDYARFAQMLLNGGELDGARVLGRKTVELMASNQIAALTPRPAGAPAGFGFGVQVGVASADTAAGLYSPGQFGWGGAAGTHVIIDPRERLFALLLLQHSPGSEDGIQQKFCNTVYQALVGP